LYPEDAAVDFECALMRLRKARDSNGLLIRLGPSIADGYSARALFKCVYDFASKYGPHSITTYIKGTMSTGIEKDPDGELTFARNLQLLMNAYVAAVEYERVREPTNLKTPVTG
jgi:hypothetical protein